MLNRYTRDKLERIKAYLEEAKIDPEFFTKYARKEIRRILDISMENLKLGHNDAKIVIRAANKALRELSRHRANVLETLDESQFKRRRIREKPSKKRRKGLEVFTEEELFRKKVEPVKRKRIPVSEEEYDEEQEKLFEEVFGEYMEEEEVVEEETTPLWLSRIYERQIKGNVPFWKGDIVLDTRFNKRGTVMWSMPDGETSVMFLEKGHRQPVFGYYYEDEFKYLKHIRPIISFVYKGKKIKRPGIENPLRGYQILEKAERIAKFDEEVKMALREYKRSSGVKDLLIKEIFMLLRKHGYIDKTETMLERKYR